ncbi:MAG: NUDIX hydrolase [Deltaproteobacteria bacterium]|nr:NUDIX hydrolase [Deltaproteobacteria bacterium]
MEKRVRTVGSLNAASFSVYLDDVVLANGEPARRIRIDHPEASAVIPLTRGGEAVMVRQYRYALGMETLEIPAGKVDPGEDAEACARRELLEETGYRAGELVRLYTYTPAIGYSNERIHIFAAPDVDPQSEKTDEREISSVEIIPLEALRTMVRKGEILDGKTLIGLAVAGLLEGACYSEGFRSGG